MTVPNGENVGGVRGSGWMQSGDKGASSGGGISMDWYTHSYCYETRASRYVNNYNE